MRLRNFAWAFWLWLAALCAAIVQRVLWPQKPQMPVPDPAARLNARQERLCRNGGSFPWTGESGRYRLYAPGGEFLALGSCENGVMKTVKSFFALPEET